MRSSRVLWLCAAIFFASCSERDVEKADALMLASEVKRVGVESFSAKIVPDLGIKPAHYVAVRDMEVLSPELRDQLAECFLIGEKSAPRGLSFAGLKGGSYYVSFDGTGVPEYFKSYKTKKVLDNVYRYYR